MPIKHAISFNYFKFVLYDKTLALLVIVTLFLFLFRNL